MIVVDANIMVRALRSRNGASHRILRSMLTGELAFALSPAVVLEYEDVLLRPGVLGTRPWIGSSEIGAVLDALCPTCVPTSPAFHFRPFLGDPKDDLYVDCALSAGAKLIVTEDRHFRNPDLSAFGLQACNAVEFVTDWQARRVSS